MPLKSSYRIPVNDELGDLLRRALSGLLPLRRDSADGHVEPCNRREVVGRVDWKWGAWRAEVTFFSVQVGHRALGRRHCCIDLGDMAKQRGHRMPYPSQCWVIHTGVHSHPNPHTLHTRKNHLEKVS